MDDVVRMGAAFSGGTALVMCAIALWMGGLGNSALGVELLASAAAVVASAAMGAVAAHGHIRLSGAAAISLHALLTWLEGALLSRTLPRRIHIATFCASLLRALTMITLHRRALRKRNDA